MAEDSGASAGMGMIVGALVVIIALAAAFFFFGGANMFGGDTKKVDVTVSAPQLPSSGGN